MKDYDGEYTLDARKTHIQWILQLIDAENSTGSMEFETKSGQVEDFFPIIVSFHSEQTYTGLKVKGIIISWNAELSSRDRFLFFLDHRDSGLVEERRQVRIGNVFYF